MRNKHPIGDTEMNSYPEHQDTTTPSAASRHAARAPLRARLESRRGRRGWTHRLGARIVAFGCAAGLAAALGGCARYAEDPEINPRAWAPGAVDREWSAQSPDRVTWDVASAVHELPQGSAVEQGHQYDLATLIDVALDTNPETRRSWQASQAAAARFGKSRAPFYPSASVESQSGYQRLIDEVPKHWGVLKNWESRNLFALNYVLMDFGRRSAESESAHQQLIAANFAFNRKVQEVVFNVEQAFYLLDAAKASVVAANSILALARTDRDAADKLKIHGLATQPNVLLARQREAQAEYDLENAKLMVSDAQADLAVALGVTANATPDIESLDTQPVPPMLGPGVDELINVAVRERPDLAAKVSTLRASTADVDLARAQLYPTVDVSTFYGMCAFSYRLSNPTTSQFTALGPEYGAQLTLKWDLFVGFDHVNSIRGAQADREAARAELRSAELDAAASVWRAYFSFKTALKKYEYAQALLAASQSAYDSNLKSYRRGLATIVDLLSAERDLANARYTLIASKAGTLVSAASVAYATGAVPDQARP